MDIQKLPKISLHDHLDGGLRSSTMIEIADEIGYKLPESEPHGLSTWFYQNANSGSLERYLVTFDHTIAVMQKPEHLRRIATETVLDLHADGVIYAELRWAPEQHQQSGLTLQEAVDAVQDGLEEGMELVEAMGGFIRTGQIVSAMRQGNRSLEIAELAVANRNDGVVGFDIAGPEKGFPPSMHKTAFDFLADQLMPITVHAGEADGLSSIKDAIVTGRALRLGHGVNIIEDVMLTRTEGDTDLVLLGPVAEWVHDRQIALEISPSSNLQTGAGEQLGSGIANHPFDSLYELGFQVTVNTDNRLQSATTLTRELEMLSENFEYGIEDLHQFQINAVEASFQSLDTREELMEMIDSGFTQFE